MLFISHCKLNNTKTYDKKNDSVLKELKNDISVKIYVFNSFINSILKFYNISYEVSRVIQNNRKYANIGMFLQQTFLIPTKAINKYIISFKKSIKNSYIIGLHIRTGFLSDFGERDNRFFDNGSISLYINKINRIVKDYNLSRIYVVSDSTLIKKYIISKYDYYILNFSVPGEICHSRYSMHRNNKPNKCVVKLIAENYLLSECNVIVGSVRSTYFGLACNRRIIRCISIY